MSKPKPTIDEILDDLEWKREAKINTAAVFRGKGFKEDKPEKNNGISRHARAKLGDWEDGYCGWRDKEI